MDTRLHKQLIAEIEAINDTLTAFGLNASTKECGVIVGGDQLVLYGLRAKAGQAISDIEKRLPELSEAISGKRRTKTLVRLLRHPLRLEVTHPQRKPLLWNVEALTGAPHTMLLGRTYDGGARDLWHSFGDAPHVLVAGTTGAGKSVAMLNMLLPLCWNTSPADLRIVLIDMKNTDLVPLRRLPHADVLATTINDAVKVLETIVVELERRQARQINMPRLMVVIDEYADLTTDADCMRLVGSLARKGRSANINLLVATQHPTGKALGDSTIKNNFAARCVGLVADASAASCAAGRPGTHAELLPGKGAFLYVTGLDCIRYQSYLLDEITSESLITRIGRKWRGARVEPLAPVQNKKASALVYETSEPVLNHREPVLEPRREPLFPLADKRALTPIEAVEVRRLYATMSKSELCRLVYESKSGRYMDWIGEALDGSAPEPVVDNKIIKLRRVGG